jgi:hypothetical protein
MTDWPNLLLDDYKSPVFDELHARIENYQIYSFAVCDQTIKEQIIDHDIGISLTESVRTARMVDARPSTNRVFIPFPSLPNLISRGKTIRWYSKLIAGVTGKTYSELKTVDVIYSGDDDPNRTIPRDLYSKTIVDFNSAGWNLDAEIIYDDVIGGGYEYSSDETISIDYFYTDEPYIGNRAPIINAKPLVIIEEEQSKCVAFQSFSPHGKIEQRFDSLIKLYPYNKYTGNKVDYINLITGLPSYDARSLPTSVTFTSPITGKITYSFYRNNRYETHPRVTHSLDLIYKTINVKQGKFYTLNLTDVVLGTLIIDNLQIEGLVRGYAKNNQLPAMFLFENNIGAIMSYWESLIPVLPPSTPRLASSFTQTDRYFIPSDLIFRQTILTSTPVVRIMAANNNYWGHGSNVFTQNPLATTHDLFDFNYTALFETLQPDGSLGTYIMDSIRIIDLVAKIEQIHKALDAETYAIDPETGEKRIANLGWLIEKMSNILGLRRKPSGKYLDKVDQAKYDRNRLNSPKWAQGDYDLNSWGNRGYALRHLPTSYENGQRQDNQYDLVHDIPQLLAAVLDQIDLGQGLQHTAEIRLKVGKEVQSYPNVGQLTIDLAARVIELEALVEKMAVMQIETSNSVRELFPGIGIPVATKSVSIDIGGKQQQIFYPGFQSGKGSIRDSLSAIKVNLGIVLGQLMPQKKPDSRWNPFDRKPKS